MKKEELQRLYREKILIHNKQPYHFNKKEGSDKELLAYNPTCGDKFMLYLNFDDKICTDGHFHGFGCAISKASSSILLEHIEGKSKEEIITTCQQFIDALQDDQQHTLGDEAIDILIELKNFEGRIDCVKLSWESLLKDLEKESVNKS